MRTTIALAAAINPKNAVVFLKWATLLAAAGKDAEALAQFRAALALENETAKSTK